MNAVVKNGVTRLATLMRNTWRWRSLAEAYDRRLDNFLLLRFVAASMVIYAHSYALSGMHKADIFVRAGWGADGGRIAVDMFFCISGFLVTGSLMRWQNAFAFIKARALRLLPAYAVCLLACAYVLGPLITTLSLDAYLRQPDTHAYVTANLGLQHMRWNLPGVFDSNPYPVAVNGSIWTLPAEASMYLWLAALGLVGLFRRNWLATCAILAVSAFALRDWLAFPMLIANPKYLPFAALFALGSLAFIHRQRIPLGHGWMLACIVLACATHGSALYPYFFGFAQAFFCFWFAYCLPWHGFNRLGDYSYGIYLWGFPCGQLAVIWLGHPRPSQISLIAFPMALTLAVASWHLLEQPALRLKDWSILERLHLMRKTQPEQG